LRQLLSSIGVSFGKPYQTLVDGVKTRIYSVDRDKLSLLYRVETLAAIARKFDDYLESETAKKINWQEHQIVTESNIDITTELRTEIPTQPESPTHLLRDETSVSSHPEVFATPESAPATAPATAPAQNYSLGRVGFGVNDLVKYTGDRFTELKEIPLIVVDISDFYATCKKPDGYFTTWLPTEELSRCDCLVTAA
jgi:hypothetical protein